MGVKNIIAIILVIGGVILLLKKPSENISICQQKTNKKIMNAVGVISIILGTALLVIKKTTITTN